MEAAVYLRQFVDLYGDELTISRQREDCLKLCEARGWTPHEYVDNDRSATKGRRPAYERMLDDIRASHIGAVVVWDLDRLHRRPIELEHFIDLTDQQHVALASIAGEADLSTDNGRLFARIKGAVARAEVERKSVRQKRAARQRAEAGIWCIGLRPFGYTESGGLVAAEAVALREAYFAILANASLYSIAAHWNSAGIKTVKGKMWTDRTVKRTMLRPRYAGFRFYQDEILGKADWPAWRTPATPPRQLVNSAGLASGSRVNPAVSEKDKMPMTNTQSGPEAALAPYLSAAGQAFRAVHRAERARERVRVAQRSAADSVDRSADSQERAAKVYEEAAEQRDPVDREECQEHAARHHRFAQDDRRMAQQLRQMAKGDSDG
jgi:DNA invertase Pin-like site-specific DNA recombinase